MGRASSRPTLQGHLVANCQRQSRLSCLDFLREVGQGYRHLVKEDCELLLGNKDLTLCLLHTSEDEPRMHFVVHQMMRLTDCYGFLRKLIRAFQFMPFIADGTQ